MMTMTRMVGMKVKGTKKERRQERHKKNIEKEIKYKQEAWSAGKIIEPNHNGGSYPGDYSIEVGKRLKSKIYPGSRNFTAEEYISKFRLWKMKIQDFILHYSPEIPKSSEYLYLKHLLETYWDEPENLLKEANGQ